MNSVFGPTRIIYSHLVTTFKRNKMEISAAIIGKNSTKTLEYTILSLRGICNQIVYVDTGSTDNSPSLATRLGAEVFFFEWQNDFALARNFALKYVRNDWVLVIDTDEILAQFNFDEIESKLASNPNIGGFNVEIKNYLNKDDLNQFSVHNYTRLFQKHPSIFFTGKIHEQVRNSIESLGMDIVDSGIVIEHFGYMDKSPEKLNRNLEILENEVNSSNNDVYLKYHLAQTEFSMKNFRRAKDIFTEIYNSPFLTDEQKTFSKIRLGQIFISENNFSEAEKYLIEPTEEQNLDGLRMFVLAAAKMSLHDFQTAYDIYQNPKLLNSSYVDKNIIDQALSALKQIIK